MTFKGGLVLAEASLAKYHLLHFVLGAIFAAILLAVPKLVGIMICVFLASLVLPAWLLPDFAVKKYQAWLSAAAVLAGAIAVAALFHYLGKL